jgi:hypothetical protein
MWRFEHELQLMSLVGLLSIMVISLDFQINRIF